MPRIFDNIDTLLLPALQESMAVATRADFCVGYFNLRGWKQLDRFVDPWAGTADSCCRLLVGMQRLPEQQLRALFGGTDDAVDNQAAAQLRKQMAQEFRTQLLLGTPTNEDEEGLRRLSAQIKAKKIVVKLFLRTPLHAKLYLCHRPDPINPAIGFVGSSNLTFAGLAKNGELNVDVLDHDACAKLQKWFEDRWTDKFCIDISDELAEVIDASWAREELVPPYHIYLKIAYHLSREALAGLAEFTIPKEFGNQLLDFQVAAVKIAARHVNKRGGVVLGDVVGLGKTLMATALARILEDQGTETLVICPKNLVSMWQDHIHRYRLRAAHVVSLSAVLGELPEMRRYRVVLVDESHNLRNREGRRFRAIQEYVAKNESKCILLSATPYNKSHLDLSSQLRLFLPEDKDLGIRPERVLRELGETEFIRRHQCSVRSLAAFEKSAFAEDWRELMRRFLVRRTRSFIQANYAVIDALTGAKYLTFEDGSRSYFPVREPHTVKFRANEKDPTDTYAQLYGDRVVAAINGLHLPRYGLGNYVAPSPDVAGSAAEGRVIQRLSRAGKRLMGFCRTNLFKRLESSGDSFLTSVARHVLRNYVVLHALEQQLPVPIGQQDPDVLDAEAVEGDLESAAEDDDESATLSQLRANDTFAMRARALYQVYSTSLKDRFDWLRSSAFAPSLTKHLLADTRALVDILERHGQWDPANDAKLEALYKLLAVKHQADKVLVFTQYAETAGYLHQELTARGVAAIDLATGDSEDLAKVAWRFSPVSNRKRDQVPQSAETRVLIATDVMSEGLNLQDCSIVVNFDLPWAIIRLTQRAGRIDRIGQQASHILCYSFLPAKGVERILQLRRRVRQRLRENAEVVGSDEAFFEGDHQDQPLLDLYHEKAGALDGDDGGEVDLASYAYQIWKNAIDADPTVKPKVEGLPNVSFSAKSWPKARGPSGALVYVRTNDDTDALVWLGSDSANVSQSQFEILRAAECSPDTPPLARAETHHALVAQAVAQVAAEESMVGGQLGRPSGARFRTYERLKGYLASIGDHRDLFTTEEHVRSLERAVDDVYRHPLKLSAKDTLNRQLRTGIDDARLAELVLRLRNDNQLCVLDEQIERRPPDLICSLGLISDQGE